MTRAKGKAIKKAQASDRQIERPSGPLYITGCNIGELKSFIEGLPDDMTIALETSDHDAVPLSFSRVVTSENPRGESEQIALFHQVTKESLNKMKAAIAGKK
jgi:hypothetical protein